MLVAEKGLRDAQVFGFCVGSSREGSAEVVHVDVGHSDSLPQKLPLAAHGGFVLVLLELLDESSVFQTGPEERLDAWCHRNGSGFAALLAEVEPDDAARSRVFWSEGRALVFEDFDERFGPRIFFTLAS